jgi:hypothetical protein
VLPDVRVSVSLVPAGVQPVAAVEFNGIQHAQYPNPFHSTFAQFEALCKRDALKVQLCKENNVRLFLIPHTVQRDEIELVLRNQLQHKINSIAGGTQATPADATDSDISEADVLLSLARINVNS